MLRATTTVCYIIFAFVHIRNDWQAAVTFASGHTPLSVTSLGAAQGQNKRGSLTG